VREILCAAGRSLARQVSGALFHVFGKLLRLHNFIDETPVFGALAGHVLIGTENVA